MNRCLAEGRERFRSLALPQRGRQPLRGTAAAALRLLRRRGERRGAGVAARAPARLRPLPGDDARLPGGPAGARGAGARCRRLAVAARTRARRPCSACNRDCRGSGGGADSALAQIAASEAARGAGMAALAKLLAVCAGTAGGAAACVGAGVVPVPIDLTPDHSVPPRGRAEPRAPGRRDGGVDTKPAPRPLRRRPSPAPEPRPEEPRTSRPGRAQKRRPPKTGRSNTRRRCTAPPPETAAATSSAQRFRRRGVRPVSNAHFAATALVAVAFSLPPDRMRRGARRPPTPPT